MLHLRPLAQKPSRWGEPAVTSLRKANQFIMLSPEFLRRQAENCLRIARSCFDLASAERLRLMAAELNAKAAEIDEQNRHDRWPRTLDRSTSS
jgi:hypothetical protein